MAFDEGLAQRIRELLGDRPGLVEKKMFGGVGFMIQGNISCGVSGDEMIVRVGPDRYEEAITSLGVRPFDMTGRPMKGWIMVGPEGYEADDDLQGWVDQGVAFALTLPPK